MCLSISVFSELLTSSLLIGPELRGFLIGEETGIMSFFSFRHTLRLIDVLENLFHSFLWPLHSVLQFSQEGFKWESRNAIQKAKMFCILCKVY